MRKKAGKSSKPPEASFSLRIVNQWTYLYQLFDLFPGVLAYDEAVVGVQDGLTGEADLIKEVVVLVSHRVKGLALRVFHLFAHGRFLDGALQVPEILTQLTTLCICLVRLSHDLDLLALRRPGWTSSFLLPPIPAATAAFGFRHAFDATKIRSFYHASIHWKQIQICDTTL
jgi:hypothetical protein